MSTLTSQTSTIATFINRSLRYWEWLASMLGGSKYSTITESAVVVRMDRDQPDWHGNT